MNLETPVVLFVYNRPEHTRKTLESIKNANGSEHHPLIIYSDGPQNESDKEKVDEVRCIIGKFEWPNKININISDKNLGLSNSIINGVTEVVNKYDKIIVIEDDLVIGNSFLPFMNKLLNKYQDAKHISSISGYSFYSNMLLPTYYGLKIMSSWGWGTWKDIWNKIDFDAITLNNRLDQVSLNSFDFAGFSYKNLFKKQLRGEIDSWAIRFYANMYLNNWVCLYPNTSMVINNGFDGSGTHHSTKSIWYEPMIEKTIISNPFKTTREYRIIRKIIEWHVKSKKQ